MPILTEVLSIPTEVHSIQGFGQFRRLPNFAFITLYIPSAVALVACQGTESPPYWI